MAAGAQVDYDALAQQHGGIASVSGSGMDYDALAASHGGAVSNDSADPNAAIAKKYGLPSGTDLSKPYFSQSTKGIDPLAFSKAYAEGIRAEHHRTHYRSGRGLCSASSRRGCD